MNLFSGLVLCAYWDIGLEELKNDPDKVRCLVCQAHVFGTVPFQRRAAKKHIESQAHQRAVRAAERAKEEDSAIRIKNQRLDAKALAAEEINFVPPLSGILRMKSPPAPQTLINRDETLREKEMWETFATDGFERTQPFYDTAVHLEADEEAIDAALTQLQSVSFGTVGSINVGQFYDDGDETITNVMRKHGKTLTHFTINTKTENGHRAQRRCRTAVSGCVFLK